MNKVQGKHKKICIVTISLGKGGAERSCAMLSQMLSKMGHEVHIVLLNDRISYPYSGTLFNMGLLKKGKDSEFKRLKRFVKLRSYLRKHDFDFVIDQRSKNQYFREVFYSRYIYHNVSTIYVTHSSNKRNYLTQEPNKFVKLCNKNYANVGVSNYIESSLLKASGMEKTFTIHNAFNPDWGKENNPLPRKLEGKTYILSYGRIVDAIKDYSFLIQAYEASSLWQRDIFLVIMGDGPDKQNLQQLAGKSAAAHKILFLPFDSSPFSVIKGAQFVTLTSNFEGFPMVLVESLSLGTPVVSLDIVSGPNEIIEPESNGLLIEERSIPLFAQAMERMVTDAALYETCKKNASKSVNRFSMQEISKKWNQLLTHEA
ncbi:MAG: glycosyltransferase [Bacteroidota bacterium]